MAGQLPPKTAIVPNTIDNGVPMCERHSDPTNDAEPLDFEGEHVAYYCERDVRHNATATHLPLKPYRLGKTGER